MLHARSLYKNADAFFILEIGNWQFKKEMKWIVSQLFLDIVILLSVKRMELIYQILIGNSNFQIEDHLPYV